MQNLSQLLRINVYVAQATGMSRRKADEVVLANRVTVNGDIANTGMKVSQRDIIKLDGATLKPPLGNKTIILNKPGGFVCSRNGQGARTIYELLPKEFHNLKPIGRLDKDSSGLLLLTSDGNLSYELTHPKFDKQKVYIVELDRALSIADQQMLQKGVKLYDGISKLRMKPKSSNDLVWEITMSEGRNRQIRRTFSALGYSIESLHRIKFGPYSIESLQSGSWSTLVNVD